VMLNVVSAHHRCTDMVDRSAALPNSRVLFLPTLFWVSQHEEGYFENNEVRGLAAGGGAWQAILNN